MTEGAEAGVAGPRRACGLTRRSPISSLCRAKLTDALGVDIHEEVDPGLAVAFGAAVQAGLLAGAPVDRILVNVAAHSLGLRVVGDDDPELEELDTFAPVLRRGATNGSRVHPARPRDMHPPTCTKGWG